MRTFFFALLLLSTTTVDSADAQEARRGEPGRRAPIVTPQHTGDGPVARRRGERATPRRAVPSRPVLVSNTLGESRHTRGARLQRGQGAHPVVLSGTPAERLRRSIADGRSRGRSFDPRRPMAGGNLRASGGDTPRPLGRRTR